MSILFFLFVLVPFILILLWTFHKVRQIHLLLPEVATRGDVGNLYYQMEALDALYRDLQFSKSLPPLRGFAGSPDFLRVISMTVLCRRPDHVLELGSGSSSLVIARTLQLSGRGHLYSLDHDTHYAEKTRVLLGEHGLSDWATVLHAPLVKQVIKGQTFLWYSMDAVPVLHFGVLVVDGPPMSTQSMARYPALPQLNGRISDECVIVIDDADRNDEREVLSRWRVEFPDFTQESLPCEKGCVVMRRGRRST